MEVPKRIITDEELKNAIYERKHTEDVNTGINTIQIEE